MDLRALKSVYRLFWWRPRAQLARYLMRDVRVRIGLLLAFALYPFLQGCEQVAALKGQASQQTSASSLAAARFSLSNSSVNNNSGNSNGGPDLLIRYVERMHDFTAACAALEGALPYAYAKATVVERVDKQAKTSFVLPFFADESSAASKSTDASAASDITRAALHLWVGFCEVRRAWVHELQVLKAMRKGERSGALDADILRQRSLARATTLFWQGFRLGEADVFTKEQLCERLAEQGQDSPVAQLQVVRILNGFMATYYDKLLAQSLGVPGRAAREVMQLSQCLSDAHWWSVPSAVRLGLGSLRSQAAFKERSSALHRSVGSGLGSGVRLAGAIEAMVLDYWSAQAEQPARLKQFFALGRYTDDAEHRLWDEWAVLQMQHLSDRLWVVSTGARTPPGALGQVPPKPLGQGASSDATLPRSAQPGTFPGEDASPLRPAPTLNVEDAL